MTTPHGGSPFPFRAALAALTATAILYGWYVLRHHTAGLDPAIFPQAAQLRIPHAPASLSPERPLNGVQTPGSGVTPSSRPPGPRSRPPQTKGSGAPGQRSAVSSTFLDDSGALDPFFAQLANLERHGRPEIVTILHYGDSPITADLITGDARAMLQARFGDAGHGFNLIAKPWAWYGHREVTLSDHGWKSLTGVGSMRQGVYGLGGATLLGSAGAHSTLKLADAAQTSAELQYLSEPNGGTLTLAADGVPLATISTAGEPDIPSARLVQLPPGTKQLELNVTAGDVRVLGIDLRKGNSGLLYDSLGLNGASTTVVSRTFAPGPWAAELRHAAPSLVILNYGTNESTFASFVAKQYEPELRAAIAKLRAALPTVPILIMSPMDRGEHGGLNEIHTMATIPEIVAIQRRVAADLGCGFFDTFDAMGGDGTMARWYVSSPRLVTADLIHPTPQGAHIVAEQLVQNLLLGYNRWQRIHGHGELAGASSPAQASHSSSPTPGSSGIVPGSSSIVPGSRNAVPSTGAPQRAETPVFGPGGTDTRQAPPATRPKPSAATPEATPPPSPTSADPSNSSETGGR